MARKTCKIDSNPQLDLLSGATSSSRINKVRSTNTKRVFITSDRTQLFLGRVRFDEHLKSTGLKAPLVVASILDEMNWAELIDRYAPTGRAPYDPNSMMGIVLYGFMQGVHSLRGLETLARQDIGCMWISGGICPDHACIGRFILLHEESFHNGFFTELTKRVLQLTKSDGKSCIAGDGSVVEAACSYHNLLKEESINTLEQKIKCMVRLVIANDNFDNEVGLR